ncbi:delta-like protein 3 [Cuculus canorus]|uniref:delta-like protein 3 n=1 Tax=Cuculus canorus TaxID=55661 RepID=UPI0023AA304B|nr:delta-like protein 3 [Cuculus canorus]
MAALLLGAILTLLSAPWTEGSGELELRVLWARGEAGGPCGGSPPPSCLLLFRLCLRPPGGGGCSLGVTHSPPGPPPTPRAPRVLRLPFAFPWPGTVSLVIESWRLDEAEGSGAPPMRLLGRARSRWRLVPGGPWWGGTGGGLVFRARLRCRPPSRGPHCAPQPPPRPCWTPPACPEPLHCRSRRGCQDPCASPCTSGGSCMGPGCAPPGAAVPPATTPSVSLLSPAVALKATVVAPVALEVLMAPAVTPQPPSVALVAPMAPVMAPEAPSVALVAPMAPVVAPEALSAALVAPMAPMVAPMVPMAPVVAPEPPSSALVAPMAPVVAPEAPLVSPVAPSVALEAAAMSPSVSPCALGPCFNGGWCVPTSSTGYTCRCRHGYRGSNCERRADRCHHGLCLHGGHCQDLGRGPLCKCRPGFVGRRCEINTDDCSPNPCANGGTCQDGANAFTCSCTLGYAGPTCRHRADACASRPCLHGGTCFTHISGLVCACAPGFMGARCEEEVGGTPRPPRAPPFAVAALLPLALVAPTVALAVAARRLRSSRSTRSVGTPVKSPPGGEQPPRATRV